MDEEKILNTSKSSLQEYLSSPISIAAAPFLGYLVIFIWDCGICKRFGLPLQLISFNLTSIFVVAICMLFSTPFIFLFFHTINGMDSLLNDDAARCLPFSIWAFAFIFVFSSTYLSFNAILPSFFLLLLWIFRFSHKVDKDQRFRSAKLADFDRCHDIRAVFIRKFGGKGLSRLFLVVISLVGVFLLARESPITNNIGFVKSDNHQKVLTAVFGDTYIYSTYASKQQVRAANVIEDNSTNLYTTYVTREITIEKLGDHEPISLQSSNDGELVLLRSRKQSTNKIWDRIRHYMIW